MWLTSLWFFPVLLCCCIVEGCQEPAMVTVTVWQSSRTKPTSLSTLHLGSSTSSLFTTRSRRKVRSWCRILPLSTLNDLSSLFLLSSSEFDDPSALVVLLEEELVVVDLQSPGWPTLPTPYLAPLHSSAITCSFHISSVPPKLWERLVNAGKAQQGLQQTHRVRSIVTWGSYCAD